MAERGLVGRMAARAWVRANYEYLKDFLRDYPPTPRPSFFVRLMPLARRAGVTVRILYAVLEEFRLVSTVYEDGQFVVYSNVRGFERADVYDENDHVSGFSRRTNVRDVEPYFWNPGRFVVNVLDFDRKVFTVRDQNDSFFVERRHDQIVDLASLRVRVGREFERLFYEATQIAVQNVSRRFSLPFDLLVFRNVSGNLLWRYVYFGPYFRFWANQLVQKQPQIIDYLYRSPDDVRQEWLNKLIRRWVKKALPNVGITGAQFKHDIDVLVVARTDDPHWMWFRVMFELKNWSPTRSPDVGELWRFVTTANLVGALPVFVPTYLSQVVPTKRGQNFYSLPIVFRGKSYEVVSGVKKAYFPERPHFLWCYKPIIKRQAGYVYKKKYGSLAISGQLIIPYPVKPPLEVAPWRSKGPFANDHVRRFYSSHAVHYDPRFAVDFENPVMVNYPALPLQSHMYIPRDLYFEYYDLFLDLGYYYDANVEVDGDYLRDRWLVPQIEYVLSYFLVKWDLDYVVRWKHGR